MAPVLSAVLALLIFEDAMPRRKAPSPKAALRSWGPAGCVATAARHPNGWRRRSRQKEDGLEGWLRVSNRDQTPKKRPEAGARPPATER